MQKVIVLGMDGLDPDVIEDLMGKGELPNFQKLKDMGSYARLQTVYPPQSPVAWSTFATGLNPGGHGLYDFLWRHADNYIPDLALSELKSEKVQIFGIKTPVEKKQFVNRRKGIPFWKITSEKGVPTTVIHCPVTFPPEKVSQAMLSGMGVPDIRGTQGTFSFYSSDKAASEKAQGGIRIHVQFNNETIDTVIRGPIGENKKAVEVPLKIQVDRENRQVRLNWADQETVVKLREWSPWARVQFQVSPAAKLEGMTRFYLRSLEPHFELYASALNFTPEKPVYAISYPDDYAMKLKQVIGDFHTLGMPHDTWALNEGAMSEDMFLEQAETVLKEEVKMLSHELSRFKEGLFVFVIETPDRVQHMFWRAVDKKSPLYTEEFAAKYGHVVQDAYKRMDEILGLVMAYLDERTTLMVISDHGFKSFRRAVHINSWLREHGFLKLQQGTEGKEFFQGVDWASSTAYAVGLGSIYLNLRGREGKGVVEEGEQAEAVKNKIIQELKQLKDEDGTPVVYDVYRKEDIFEGAMIHEAPDLLVAFNDGYRASWQTALGASPKAVIENNLKKWSGDHIIDAKLVPGIFFSNRLLAKPEPSLYDLSPTILSLFGAPLSEHQKDSQLFH